MFPYDLFTLIECVENVPCLWDKTIEDYKNKILKRNSWNEVCKILEPNFDTLEEKKKTEICNSIINKWNNIRDAFKKSLVKKSGQSQKKNYVYHNQLQFLLKVFTPEETVSSIPSESDSTQDSMSTVENDLLTTHDHPGNRKKRMNPVDVEILKILQSSNEVQKSNSPETKRLIQSDEDEAFLVSILPSIKRLPEDDRMEFRIDVMQLIRKYTNRLRLARHSTPTDTGTTLIVVEDENLREITQGENKNINFDAQASTSAVSTDIVLNSFINESQVSMSALYHSVEESETDAAVNSITNNNINSISELLNQDFENM